MNTKMAEFANSVDPDLIYQKLYKFNITFETVNIQSVELLLRHMVRLVRKPAFCICKNKDADQLRGNREADQRLCFRYKDMGCCKIIWTKSVS